MLRTFSAEERAEMTEADGNIRVTCEYCSRSFAVEPGALEAEG
jgi:molecular chaperone Hsp33